MATLTSRLARIAVMLAAVIAVSVVPADPAITQQSDAPAGCVTATTSMTMYAVELPRTPEGDVRLGYGLTPETASIPGPTIELIEGDCLAITLVNLIPEETLAELRDHPLLGSRDPEMPLGVSLHVHGVRYTTESDGTIHTDSFVPPNLARTYTWYAAPKVVAGARILSQGTAGTWWYHDHVIGTDHGTGGAGSGLFGAVIVRRATDIPADRTYVIGMGPDATINMRHFPDTDCPSAPALEDASNTCLVALQGERVEFAVIGFGDDFHTFHLHGHTWADNRTGILSSQLDDTRIIDNKTVGPADTFGFQIIAGESVGPGAWMLHCHVQTHSDRGMATFLHVLNPDGSPASAAGLDLHEHFGRS